MIYNSQLTLTALIILGAIVGAFSRQCVPLQGDWREKCALGGYNQTFPISYQMDSTWVERFTKALNLQLEDFSDCSVAGIAEIMLCSIMYAPSCIEVQSKPELPCQRVCSEWVKRCADSGSLFNDIWTTTAALLCTVLPNSTAATGICIEPPGFEAHYNPSTTGLFEKMIRKDYKGHPVLFPWCQDLQYNYTLISEELQRKIYNSYYDKNLTGIPLVDTQHGNDTIIAHWDWVLRKYPKCSKALKRAACGQHIVPPFFPEEGLKFYTLCRSQCRLIQTQCPEIMDDPDFNSDYWLVADCGLLAYGVTSHGFCEHKSWPNPHEWINSFESIFGVRPTTKIPPKSKALSPGMIVTAVVVPVVIMILVIVGILLWRNRLFVRLLFWYSKGDDTKEIVE